MEAVNILKHTSNTDPYSLMCEFCPQNKSTEEIIIGFMKQVDNGEGEEKQPEDKGNHICQLKVRKLIANIRKHK